MRWVEYGLFHGYGSGTAAVRPRPVAVEATTSVVAVRRATSTTEETRRWSW